LAYAVGRFEYVDAGTSAYGAPIRIITLHGRAADAAWAAESTPKILAGLERWFGTPYPFPKLDSIAIPMTNFGAMENPGLITYRESLLLIPAAAADRRREAYVEVAAHELAHQWFGNLVTPAWWDDIWLNESFATWIPSKVLGELYPTWTHPEDAVVGRHRSLDSDSLGTARAIRQPIISEDDIVTAFDGITYGKGAAVLRMLEDWIGAERFQVGVRAYLARHARGNATADDFIAAVAVQAPDVAVSAALSGFLDQTGAPRVAARTECPKRGRARVALAQGRYLPLGAIEVVTPRWHLPVCVQAGIGGKGIRACTVLAGADGVIELPGCPAWVWPNAGGRGYYRSSLDEAGWRALLTRGWRRLSGSERLAAVQDLLAAVEAGEMGVNVALDLVPSLVNQNFPEIVHLAVKIVDGIDAWISDEWRPAFALWIVKQFGPLARKRGDPTALPVGVEEERLRSAVVLLVAELGADRGLRESAVAQAPKWRTLPEAIRGDVLVMAVRAQPSMHDELLTAFKSETDRTLRGELARALGSVPEPERLASSLALTLDPGIDIRVTAPILWAAVDRRDTRVTTEAFVIEHFDELVARMPGDSALALLRVITASCDATKVEPLRALSTAKLGQKRGAQRRIDQTFERMSQCAARRQAAVPALASWLAKLPRR
jgi:alanyl aminopeptidase